MVGERAESSEYVWQGDYGLAIVFDALAVSREAQARTGASNKKILNTLRPLRSPTSTVGSQQITAPAPIPPETQSVSTHSAPVRVVTSTKGLPKINTLKFRAG